MQYPYDTYYDDMFKASVNVVGGDLRVQAETVKWRMSIGNFLQTLQGHRPDTDSAQAAVRWFCPGQKIVVSTNALAQTNTRSRGANWTHGQIRERAGKVVHEDAYWPTPVPPNANHCEIVLVWTDALFMTNAQHGDSNANSRQLGDVPLVIGSWSGTKDSAGNWTFTLNSGDLTGANIVNGQKEYPTMALIQATAAASQRVVKSRTGCTLQARTFGGSPAMPDTGFDIVAP